MEKTLVTKTDLKKKKDTETPVSDGLCQHARLRFWNQNRKAEINQLDSQRLLLAVDEHHVVWLNVGVQDSDVPQGFQSHQKLWHKKRKNK